VQKERAYELSTDNALWMAQNLTDQQQFVENNVKQLLTLLSQLPEIKNIDTTRINQIFSVVLNQNPYYASLLMVDTSGNLISSGTPHGQINVRDRRYFSEVVTTKKFTIGEFAKGRLTKKPVLHYAIPVFNADSTIKAVLVTSFDLKYYDSFIKLPEFSHDIVFTLLDHNGVILYHSANLSIINGLKERKDILENFTKNTSEGTFASMGNDGVKRLYGFERLKGSDNKPYMYIYVGIPEKIAYADYNQTLVRNTIIMLLAVIFVVILAYFFSNRYIIQPIDGLLKSAELISEGNLDNQTGIIESSSELGKLSLAIDQMSTKLRLRDLERKKVEKDLRKMKERFELAINSANIGIWDWHIRNNSLIWDTNMMELYGTSSQNFDCTLESWRKLIFPADLSKFNEQFSNAVQFQTSFRSEFRIQHPVAGLKHIRIFADVILDKEKQPVRLIGVNWDITERIKQEHNLNEAKERVENNFKLKSAYLANINHEIRTPIHGIIGFSQILKSNDVSHDELIQYLDFIEISGNKLMVTMSNIIDFQLLDAGQLELNKTEALVFELLEDVFLTAQQNSSKKESNCCIIMDSNSENIALFIDKQRVFQILTSILEHLVDLNKDSHLHLGCETSKDEFVFYVNVVPENEGQLQDCSLEINTLESVSNENNLKGLSLTLCNKLAEYMGGRISFYSHSNVFRINLHLPYENNTISIHQNFREKHLFV
jgi:signal transduction histidine kinase